MYFLNVGGKIRSYFVQITQNKALFWNARKENIIKMQTRTQTHFIIFVFVYIYIIYIIFYLCREKTKILFWSNKALFYRLYKRNTNRNIKEPASSRNFWIYISGIYILFVYLKPFIYICAGQSKTNSIMKNFIILLNYNIYSISNLNLYNI